MKKFIIFFAVLFLIASSLPASAALSVRDEWVGNYAISTDGWGGTDQAGVISAEIPASATVVAAYMYSATYSLSTANPLGTVTLDGSPVTFFDQWDLQWDVPNNRFFRTGISDVTAIVQAKYDGGGGVYDFDVTESSGFTDGEALVVVYQEASLPTATVAVLDGPQELAGDNFNVNFSDPLDPTDPGFFAEMRLGITFSCCSQRSNVEVNGGTLSNNAGNNDDGEIQANGSLITVGGFDDDLLNTNTYAGDDERYNLAPFITGGDTSINIFTNNPSNDDNIFLAAFYLSGEGSFEPPNGVPEPTTMILLGFGLLGIAGFRGRFKKS